MALYAFDGTWNQDQVLDDRDTNVRKFFELSEEPDEGKLYTEGIGTRFGFVGRAVGGAFGAGGRDRVNAAYDHLRGIWTPGELDPHAPLHLPKDLIRDDFRRCGADDRAHYTVGPVAARTDRDNCNAFTFTNVETEADEVTLAPRL